MACFISWSDGMIDHGWASSGLHDMAPEKKKGAHPHPQTPDLQTPTPLSITPLVWEAPGGQEAGGSGRDPSRSQVSHERLVLEAGYRVICIATLPCLKGDDGLVFSQ